MLLVSSFSPLSRRGTLRATPIPCAAEALLILALGKNWAIFKQVREAGVCPHRLLRILTTEDTEEIQNLFFLSVKLRETP
jgi:hypothetical protein